MKKGILIGTIGLMTIGTLGYLEIHASAAKHNNAKGGAIMKKATQSPCGSIKGYKFLLTNPSNSNSPIAPKVRFSDLGAGEQLLNVTVSDSGVAVVPYPHVDFVDQALQAGTNTFWLCSSNADGQITVTLMDPQGASLCSGSYSYGSSTGFNISNQIDGNKISTQKYTCSPTAIGLSFNTSSG